MRVGEYLLLSLHYSPDIPVLCAFLCSPPIHPTCQGPLDSWLGVREKGSFLVLTASIAREPNGIMIHGALLLKLPGPVVILGSCPSCTGHSPHRQPPLPPPTCSILVSFCSCWDMGPLGNSRVEQLYAQFVWNSPCLFLIFQCNY